MTRVLAFVCLVAAISTSGCQGDDGSGVVASKQDFCRGWHAMLPVFAETGPIGSKLKEAASELQETGVPDDLSGEAREGLEIYFARIASLSDDATVDDWIALKNTPVQERALNRMADYGFAKSCTRFADARTPAGADPAR